MTPLLYRSFEKILNHYVSLDQDSLLKLTQFSGKTLAIVLTGLNARVYVKMTEQHIAISQQSPDTIQATMTGTPLTLLRLFLSEKKANMIFSGEVLVEGDVEFAQQLSHFFSHLQVDWEEQLSKIMGDVCAHQLGSFARSLQGGWKKLSSTAKMNTTEYVQEEIRLCPPSEELNDFYEDVDRLRDDVERLAARVQRLLLTSR